MIACSKVSATSKTKLSHSTDSRAAGAWEWCFRNHVTPVPSQVGLGVSLFGLQALGVGVNSWALQGGPEAPCPGTGMGRKP